MGELGNSLTVALAAARHSSIDAGLDAEPAGELTTACRVLGDLLGLDASWILAGDGLRPTVLARWSREGVRPHRLGAARLASILAECPSGCTGRRDGRYAVIVAPVEAAGERLGTLVGSVRSAHEFGPAALGAAELIAAGAAAAIATRSSRRRHGRTARRCGRWRTSRCCTRCRCGWRGRAASARSARPS
jgi:hypothetical protein